MGVDVTEVRIYCYEPATWAYSSLGCPEYSGPGEQVATQGSVVLIEAGGYVLVYRTDDLHNRIVLCEVHPM